MEKRLGLRGRAAASRKTGRPPHGPPICPEHRKALFSHPPEALPEVRPRAWLLMALIKSGRSTSDVLVDEMKDQMHRTTVFVFLAELVEMGLLVFRRVADDVGPPKREFKLTMKGNRCLNLYVAYMNELSKPTPSRSTTKEADETLVSNPD
jgi:DNA-binding HxlR family transcriptional regulator